MNILALLGALAIGITLGLLGSGGSILTVPVLVFLLDQSEKTAIAGSLAIVGSIAFIAALPYMRQRLVEWRSVLLFGLPSMLGTVAGAWAAQFVSGAVQLFVFALVMLVASFTMFRTAPAARGGTDPRARWKEMADGLGVGMLTGLVGVGGGFLIVPALVLLGGLAMSPDRATTVRHQGESRRQLGGTRVAHARPEGHRAAHHEIQFARHLGRHATRRRRWFAARHHEHLQCVAAVPRRRQRQ